MKFISAKSLGNNKGRKYKYLEQELSVNETRKHKEISQEDFELNLNDIDIYLKTKESLGFKSIPFFFWTISFLLFILSFILLYNSLIGRFKNEKMFNGFNGKYFKLIKEHGGNI
jgi:hypothetical protein